MSRQDGHEGLFTSLNKLATTLLTVGQARLELLGNEFETQKLRALRMLVLALATVFCAGLAILLVVALVTLSLWEQRVLVVAVCSAIFAVATFLLGRSLVRMAAHPEPPFAASMAELQEDLRQLRAASGHAKSSD